MLAQLKLDNINIPHSPAPIDVNYMGLTIGDVISKILPYVFSIAGILLLIYLLAGGFQLMMSRGEPKATAGAWGKITNAAIGLLIVFIAFWLTQLIGKVFNITAFGNIFK